MFSADLTPEERHSRLGHMVSVPTAAFVSGADEFVPPAPEGLLAETLRAAMVSAGPPGDVSAGSAAGVRSGRGVVLFPAWRVACFPGSSVFCEGVWA